MIPSNPREELIIYRFQLKLNKKAFLFFVIFFSLFKGQKEKKKENKREKE